MIETYKILSGKYDRDCTEGMFHITEDGTRGNTKKLFKNRSRLNIRKYAFPNRVVNIWNSLPEWVVNAENVEKFERKLDKHWQYKEKKFYYKARILPTTMQSHAVANSVANELEPQA